MSSRIDNRIHLIVAAFALSLGACSTAQNMLDQQSGTGQERAALSPPPTGATNSEGRESLIAPLPDGYVSEGLGWLCLSDYVNAYDAARDHSGTIGVAPLQDYRYAPLVEIADDGILIVKAQPTTTDGRRVNAFEALPEVEGRENTLGNVFRNYGEYVAPFARVASLHTHNQVMKKGSQNFVCIDQSAQQAAKTCREQHRGISGYMADHQNPSKPLSAMYRDERGYDVATFSMQRCESGYEGSGGSSGGFHDEGRWPPEDQCFVTRCSQSSSPSSPTGSMPSSGPSTSVSNFEVPGSDGLALTDMKMSCEQVPVPCK